MLRYVKGTLKLGDWYIKGSDVHLIGYTDSDGFGSLDNMKSTLGYTFNLSSRVRSWNSREQDVVAQPMAKVYYITIAANFKQAM